MYPSLHVTKIQSVNFLPVIKSHLAKFTFYAENVLPFFLILYLVQHLSSYPLD